MLAGFLPRTPTCSRCAPRSGPTPASSQWTRSATRWRQRPSPTRCTRGAATPRSSMARRTPATRCPPSASSRSFSPGLTARGQPEDLGSLDEGNARLRRAEAAMHYHNPLHNMSRADEHLALTLGGTDTVEHRPSLPQGWTLRDHAAIPHLEPCASAELSEASDVDRQVLTVRSCVAHRLPLDPTSRTWRRRSGFWQCASAGRSASATCWPGYSRTALKRPP